VKPSSQSIRILGLVVALLLTTHPLPAPIFEKKSATPKPASPKPKSKPAAKSLSPPTATPVKQSRFAGKWVGTIQTFPPGNTATVLTVDSSETTMALSWSLAEPKPPVKVTRVGDTIKAKFGTGIGAATFSLTPQPDGTAFVRLQAFLNDFNATFYRTDATAGTPKSPR
jgi:hypothetical protein